MIVAPGALIGLACIAVGVGWALGPVALIGLGVLMLTLVALGAPSR